MTQDDDESGELPVLSSQEMFRMIMQEIADTNHELSAKIDGLKENITGLDRKLGKRIDGLDEKANKVASELHTLRLEVHQNHSTFIINQQDHDKRITKLEMAA